MAHVAKFTRGASGHMLGHYSREKEHLPDNIKPELTHLNYNLAEEYQPMKQIDFVRRRLSEVKVQNRSDVNVLCDWVVTAPKDLPLEDMGRFFESTHVFLAGKYGKENVVSAYVHMDEATPHLHFAFIPVVPDRKKGGYKVSAKECITKSQLKSFHNELQRCLEKELGHSVSILNEATREGNRSIVELKRGTAMEKIREADRKAAQTLKKAEKEVQSTRDSLIPVRAEYEAKKAYVEQMGRSSEEIWNLIKVKPKKTLTGKIKGYIVPAAVWDNQTITRMDAEAIRSAQKRWNEEMQRFSNTPVALENMNLRKMVKQLQVENRQLRNEVSAATSKNAVRTFAVQKENEQLKAQLESQEHEFIGRLNKVLRELSPAVASQVSKLWEAHRCQSQSRKKERGFHMEL